MFTLPPDITKKWIRSKISDEAIFERYIGRSVRLREKFCSPLRQDKKPTCNFFISRNGVLWMKDHSGHFAGNCFDLVMFMFGVDYNEALAIIAKDFNLVNGQALKEYKIPEKIINKPGKTDLKVSIREWKESDDSYWMKYYIKRELLNYFRVVPVQRLWVNNELSYSYSERDPAYAYMFTPDDIKVYFPSRKDARFYCNTSLLQGYDLLPKEGKVLIVTKSYKDIMAMYNFGLFAVAPQSESQGLTVEQYADLSERFDYIFSLYDFDLTGVKTANKMRKNYGIQPLFFTNGRFGTEDYNAKDFTDFLLTMGGATKIKRFTESVESSKHFSKERCRSSYKNLREISKDVDASSEDWCPF